MTDTSGIVMRYTCRQRRFEGKLPRHLRILEKEKAETDGQLQAERDLSKHSRKTNHHGRFLTILLRRNSTTNGRHVSIWKRNGEIGSSEDNDGIGFDQHQMMCEYVILFAHRLGK